MLTTNKQIRSFSTNAKLTDDFYNAVKGVIRAAMINNQTVISYRLFADVFGKEKKKGIVASSLDFNKSLACAVENFAIELLKANSPIIPFFAMGEKNAVIELRDSAKYGELYATATPKATAKTATPKTASEKTKAYLKKALADGLTKSELIQIINSL